MLMGKVVGSVVSTRKNENLVGNKFMIVEVADHMRQGAKQICLLYTSPSPRDGLLSRMPSSA